MSCLRRIKLIHVLVTLLGLFVPAQYFVLQYSHVPLKKYSSKGQVDPLTMNTKQMITAKKTVVVTTKPESSVTTKPPNVTEIQLPSVAPFHRYWPTNCSALFSGDKAVIKKTTDMIAKERKAGVKGELPVPSDQEVQNWTRDCSLYKRLREYPTKPLSDEEAGYPLAYIIVTHRDAAQVERLLRAIYQPQNVICIHPDGKSPQDFQRAIRGLAKCFDNVFVPSKVEIVRYAGFTRLQADINCMSDLTGPIGVKYNWKYAMNLCGQDFPLKTNLEIVHQLKAYKGHNDMNGILPSDHFKRRTRHKWPAPHNITVYFGNAYIAATRGYVEYVVHNRVGVDLLHWVDGTYSPDETYWVTLHRSTGTPGGYPIGTWESNVRFMRWGDIPNSPACVGKYVRALCIFAVGYLQHLAVQPQLFANKFHYNYDPVTLHCLEEALTNRTLRPEESKRLKNFPVTKLSWQNHTAVP